MYAHELNSDVIQLDDTKNCKKGLMYLKSKTLSVINSTNDEISTRKLNFSFLIIISRANYVFSCKLCKYF